MLSSSFCKLLKTRAQELLNIAGIIETSLFVSFGSKNTFFPALNVNYVRDICLASRIPSRKGGFSEKRVRSVWVLLRNCPFLEGLEMNLF